MRDDIGPPNLGQTPKDWDYQFLDKALRLVEQTLRKMLALGPVRVTELSDPDDNTVTVVGNLAVTGNSSVAGTATLASISATTATIGTLGVTNNATVGGDLTVTGSINGGGSIISGFVGVMLEYGGTVAPTGFLMCYGQEISRATYAALFTIIGINFGIGDGATTFNVPDFRGRLGAGKDDMGGVAAGRLIGALAEGVTGNVLGANGGEEAHTLIVAESASHNHSGVTSTEPAHTHTTDSFLATGGATAGLVRTAAGSGAAVNFATNPAGSHNHTISSQGGDGAHNNVQPTLIVNKIIYAGV